MLLLIMVKTITNINNSTITFDNNKFVIDRVKLTSIYDTNSHYGTQGQYIVADGSGGWSWSSPVQSQSVVGDINDLTDAIKDGTSYYIGKDSGINSSGLDNTFLGELSGFSNTTGNYNTFIGYKSGFDNSGGENTFIGTRCGNNNSSGSQNTSIGYNSGRLNTTGTHNTCVGSQAGWRNIGDYNIFIGSACADNATTATNCIYIGFSTIASSSSASNEIVIGNSVTGNGDNTITLGNSTVTGFYVNKIRQATATELLYYDESSGEVTKGPSPLGDHLQIIGGSYTENSITTNYDYVYIPGTQYVRAEWTFGASGLNVVSSDASLVVDGGIYIKSSNLSPPAVNEGKPLEMDLFVEGNTMLVGNTFIGPTGDLILFSAIKDMNDFVLLDSNGIKFNSDLNILNEGSNPPTYTSGNPGNILSSQGSNKPPVWIDNSINNLLDAIKSGNSYYIGENSGSTSTGNNNTFLGESAGFSNTTGDSNSLIGYKSGYKNDSGNNNVSLGDESLYHNYGGSDNVAIGKNALQGDASGNVTLTKCIAIGLNAGSTASTNTNCIYIGDSVNVGSNSANNEIVIGGSVTGNGDNTITLGNSNVTKFYVNTSEVAIGTSAGSTGQLLHAIAIGKQAGQNTQGTGSVAIGVNAGSIGQMLQSIAIGDTAGHSGQGVHTVAIGANAGKLSQQGGAIAIGLQAGETSQEGNAVAIGNGAGKSVQLSGAIAIGLSAGETSQAGNAVAIGHNAGKSSQLSGAVAIGHETGYTGQGTNSIAIGKYACYDGGSHTNTIVINATGSALNPAGPNRTYIKSIRQAPATEVLYYDEQSGEVTRGPTFTQRPYAKFVINGSSNYYFSSSGTNLTFTSAVLHSGITLSSNNYEFSVTTSGVYVITTTCRMAGTDSWTVIELYNVTTSTIVGQSNGLGALERVTNTYHIMAQINSGDTYKLVFTHAGNNGYIEPPSIGYNLVTLITGV
jgi:hypothetical protein